MGVISVSKKISFLPRGRPLLSLQRGVMSWDFLLLAWAICFRLLAEVGLVQGARLSSFSRAVLWVFFLEGFLVVCPFEATSAGMHLYSSATSSLSFFIKQHLRVNLPIASLNKAFI